MNSVRYLPGFNGIPSILGSHEFFYGLFLLGQFTQTFFTFFFGSNNFEATPRLHEFQTYPINLYIIPDITHSLKNTSN